jgi:hypothetical protein
MRGKWLAIALVIAAPALALTQGAAEIGQRMHENAEALKDYSWKMRTEMKLEGESRVVNLQQLRFDINGQLQKTQLGAPPQPPSARGIRGRKIKQKVEELQSLTEALSETALTYLHANPQQLSAFLSRANVWEGQQGSAGGATRVEGNGLVKPGDTVNIYVDSTSRNVQRMDVQTDLEGKPVLIQADYRTLENGPTYVAKATVNYPEAQMEIIVENFDYMRQN